MNRRTRLLGIPGTLCSPEIFRPLAEELHDRDALEIASWMTSPGPWTVPALATRIAHDLRGAGTDQVVLIGHSTGGAIALQLALDHPELVAALVLVDTGPNMHAHGDVDSIIATIRDSWGPELVAAVLDRSFADPLAPATREAFVQWGLQVDPAAAADVLASQRAIDYEERLDELDLPVAVVHGALDPTRTTAQAAAFAAAIRGAELHLLPCGHSPMYERPGEVAAILRSTAARRR